MVGDWGSVHKMAWDIGIASREGETEEADGSLLRVMRSGSTIFLFSSLYGCLVLCRTFLCF